MKIQFFQNVYPPSYFPKISIGLDWSPRLADSVPRASYLTPLLNMHQVLLLQEHFVNWVKANNNVTPGAQLYTNTAHAPLEQLQYSVFNSILKRDLCQLFAFTYPLFIYMIAGLLCQATPHCFFPFKLIFATVTQAFRPTTPLCFIVFSLTSLIPYMFVHLLTHSCAFFMVIICHNYLVLRCCCPQLFHWII